ncbi:uncharacterized protein LOC141936449 isoform X1 [Strix uralensis]|uniref:uncharacterized protein LOC141936449 isoform X1 n=1 Tax=Strix uralensis TaxID=36305 RepID=UPI003DA7303C
MDSCGNTGEPVTHDYLEMIEAVYSSQPDLKEEPSEVADESWYTDGSSFVRQGICKAGYAVTTEDQIFFRFTSGTKMGRSVSGVNFPYSNQDYGTDIVETPHQGEESS